MMHGGNQPPLNFEAQITIYICLRRVSRITCRALVSIDTALLIAHANPIVETAG